MKKSKVIQFQVLHSDNFSSINEIYILKDDGTMFFWSTINTSAINTGETNSGLKRTVAWRQLALPDERRK